MRIVDVEKEKMTKVVLDQMNQSDKVKFIHPLKLGILVLITGSNSIYIVNY